jgi:AhpD family alkylhydroperoxidase
MGAPALDVEWAECLVPAGPVPPALLAEVRRRLRVVPGWLPRLAPCPWVVHAVCGILAHPLAHVPTRLVDFMSLVVSQDNSCRYCYGAQRALLRIHGYREDEIARLERDFHLADVTPAERAAIDFARLLSRADPRPGAREIRHLRDAGLSPAACAEVALAAAASVFQNRLSTLLALPPDRDFESLVERPLFRVVRPLIAWRLRSVPKRPAPLPEPNDGPCAPIVAALDGSPSARLVRLMIDEAWASAVLPRRTKALVLAVTARALGCEHGVAEARRLLAAEGMPAAEVDGVLATLAAPSLDAREGRLVPLARETAHYQVPVIQRRMREATVGLSPAEIVEAAGTMALANAVCRLSVLLDAC